MSIALDRRALAEAKRLPSLLSRADLTINELPAGGAVQPGDLIPIWRNGETYEVLAGTFPFMNPSGYASIAGGATLQWGVKLLVPADGSAVAPVIFPVPFVTQAFQVSDSIDVGAADPGWTLSAPRINSLSKTGFNVMISGGPPGSTVTYRYLVTGS